MTWAERQRRLDGVLTEFRPWWQPQPFRDPRPAWVEAAPALAADLLALDDDSAEDLNRDGDAALAYVGRHLPEAAAVAALAEVAPAPRAPLPDPGRFWDWAIPGRKRTQITAFAAAARRSGRPLVDWCGGKGHLGRLLALHWQLPATCLELDGNLCAEGEALARRAGVDQRFVAADALRSADFLRAGEHVVALHACGNLHRHALVAGIEQGVAAFDIAPCCYHRGVVKTYRPLSTASSLLLSYDDLRLAVTETVTASPRLTRERDRGMAWKLGFDAWRRHVAGDAYRPFKSVPAAWLRLSFGDCCRRLAEREGLPSPGPVDTAALEAMGWRRRGEVIRLSIVRHAFRRPLEIWLAGDLACHLESRGYEVALRTFCARETTPRNLLLSARRVAE